MGIIMPYPNMFTKMMREMINKFLFLLPILVLYQYEISMQYVNHIYIVHFRRKAGKMRNVKRD